MEITHSSSVYSYSLSLHCNLCHVVVAAVWWLLHLSPLCCATGDNYVPNLEIRECLTPQKLCRGSHLNLAQTIVRCVLLGGSAVWHFVLVYHSMRDMARTAHDSFR